MNSFGIPGRKVQVARKIIPSRPHAYAALLLRYEHVVTVVPGEQLQPAQHDFR
jgi:hypothetical protein